MKHFFKNSSSNVVPLVTKIIIIIIIVFLIFNMVIYKNIYDTEKENFLDIANYVTTHTSKSISDWIEDQVSLANYLAKDTRIIASCADPTNTNKREKAVALVEEIYNEYPHQENVGAFLTLDSPIKTMVNGKSIEVATDTVFLDSVGGKTIGKRYEYMAYIDGLFDDCDYYISETYPSILRANPIIVITVPIRYNNEIIGTVFLAPKINSFVSKFLDTSISDNSGYLFLGDERGLIIAHKNPAYVLTKDLFKSPLIKNLITKVLDGENFLIGNPLGFNKHYYSQQIEFKNGKLEQDMYVIFNMDSNLVHSNSKKLLILNFIIFILAIIVIVFITYNLIKTNQNKLKEEHLLKLNTELEEKVHLRTIQLEELAKTDSLTGYLNHNTIYKVLADLITTSKKEPLFAVAMLDIDHFKNVNDSYGHPKGDEVIQAISKQIKAVTRSNDILGRYGGEEFLIIMPTTNLSQATSICERIRTTISEISFTPNNFHVTVSIGVCVYTSGSALDVVDTADKLMYKAKQTGRNKVVVD